MTGGVPPFTLASNPASNQERANNLLNLLKFNQSTPQSSNTPGSSAQLQNMGVARSLSARVPILSGGEGPDSRPLSASDVVATLKQRTPQAMTLAQPALDEARRDNIIPQAPTRQDYLLNLLKPKIQQIDQELGNTSSTASQSEPISRPAQPFLQGTNAPALTQSHLEAPKPTNPTKFNYVNPFDELHSSSPLNNPMKSPQPTEAAKSFEILQRARVTPLSQEQEPSQTKIKISRQKSEEQVLSSLVTGNEDTREATTEDTGRNGRQPERAVSKEALDVVTGTGQKATSLDSDSHPRKGLSDADNVGSSWESAEDEESSDFKVDVYNFPMKPFVSIQVKSMPPARPIRSENFMVVAQLKKDFDQIDRCLVTASQSHIVYAQVATKRDNAGFRIIRQDNGLHKHVFRLTGERVFSVQICSTNVRGDDVETVLGTGVNGSIFWNSLAKTRGDLFEDDDVESQGFIMPPVATIEENTSGSPVKTRAKMSSRHPQFFGMARGKQIFIISPETVKGPEYCNSSSRRVNSEKFFAEHSLKINTGKAGKDFCFSEDDSVIASLDKNGRFKFWDIRELTSRALDPHDTKHDPIELRDPLWMMNAAASGTRPDEKPSVSSIMFLDKERPTVKGAALRYMIIGFKQNHILQLWDLGLGKAVQEICLPHEKDSDGICSISYHAKSGIIAVGHPTRNSVYFIHLSAPKYTLPSMDQAKYIDTLARGNPSLPRPESTAIMSGLREFSFAKVGNLRSVDMLKTPVENASEGGSVEETLFELYIMHSKGVVCVPIKREDLGWDAAGKMLDPKDALAEGVIDVTELKQPHKQPAASEQAGSAETTTKQANKPAASKKDEQTRTIESAKQPDSTKPSTTSKADGNKESIQSTKSANGASKAEHALSTPTRNTVDQGSSEQQGGSDNQQPNLGPSSNANQRAKSPVKDKTVSTTANVARKATPATHNLNIGSAVNTEELQSLLSKNFESLYSRIDSERRAQDASSGAKQEALLRLVSSTLTENVDRSLHMIVSSRIQEDVIPSVTEATRQAIDRKIAEYLPHRLDVGIQEAVKANLSDALQNLAKDKELHRALSEATSSQVIAKVQDHVSALLTETVPRLAGQAFQRTAIELEQEINHKLQLAESRHLEDVAKIDELTSVINRMSSTLDRLADMHAVSQDAILKLQRDNAVAARTNAGSIAPHESAEGPTTQAPVELQSEPEDEEIAQITRALVAGDYESATIQVRDIKETVLRYVLTIY